jgi:putative peptidoglycan lipid II flippase
VTDETGAIVRRTAVMSVGTALSRITGLLRVIAIAWALGVTSLSDAYNVANTTPNIVYDLVLGGILSAVFVPVFVEWLETRSREEAWHSARAIMTFAVLLLSMVAVLVMALADVVIRVYTMGRPGPGVAEYRSLATFFLVLFMPQIVFYGWGAVATGLLNAERRFAVPMFAPILNNLTVIATMLTFAVMSHGRHPDVSDITTAEKWVLAVGTTLGVIAMTVALWPSLRRTGFRWRWVVDVRDEALRRIVRLSGWLFFYVIVNQVGYVVVIILANRTDGGYTAYSYAYIFFQLPHAIFAVSVFTALLPSLSSRWIDSDIAGYRSLLSLGIRTTALVALPAAAGYIALATPIVRLLLQHGRTTPAGADLVAGTLALFATALLSFSLFQLLLRGFYAMQDTRTPALINLGATAVGTAVNFIYFRYLGVKGLALGQTTAYTIATIAALLVMRARLGSIDGRRLTGSLARITVAAACTGVAASLAAIGLGNAVGTATHGSQLIQVVGGVVAGLGIFLVASRVLQIDEVTAVVQLVRRRNR